MATYPVTPAQVHNGPGTLYIAGEAINAGQVVRKTDDGKVYLAKNDTLANSLAIGIALNSAEINQTVGVAQSGRLTYPASFPTAARWLVLSPVSTLMDESDLMPGVYSTLMGYVTAADKFNLVIVASRSQVATF